MPAVKQALTMTIYNDRIFDRFVQHSNHRLEIASYGDEDNYAVECVDCHRVLVDFEPDDNTPTM